MTNLGPLTTTLSPPSRCFSDIWAYTPGSGFTEYSTLKWYSLGRSKHEECYPTNFNSFSDAFYSPAHCPSGWNIACNSTEIIGTATETRATCCPSDYYCFDATRTFPWLESMSCVSFYFPTSTYSLLVATYFDVDSATTTVTSLTTANIYAAAVKARWQSTDFASITSTPSSSKTADLSTGTADSSTATAAPSGGGAGGGLSTGAKAGIGVGAAAGALALIGALLLFFLRRRRQGLKGDKDGNRRGDGFVAADEPMGKPELDGTSKSMAELPGESEPRQEMYTPSHAHEMHDSSTPRELP